MLKKLLSTVAICALAASPSFAQDKPWPGSGGSSGGAVSVTSASPNIVVNPSPGTGTFTIGATVVLNAQVGTSYTFLSSDAGKLVSFNNGSAVAATLPQATGSFAAGFGFTVQNRGAGTVTITPATSTINGAATLTVAQNMGCDITSDGTNWQVSSCTALSSGGGTPGGSNTQLQYNNSGAFGGIAGATWNGTTFTLPNLTMSGSIDLSGAAGRNINLNSGSEIDVGGTARFAFDSGGNVYISAKTSSQSILVSPCNLLVTGSNGGAFLCGAPSGTVPSIIPNWGASQVTGIGSAATNVMDFIVNSVDKARVTSEGIQYKQATAPVPTGTGSPTIATGSTDEAGEVTSGTSATSVIITFNLAHTNAPFCVVTAQPQISSFAYTLSNTAITITQTATSAAKIDYRCTFP